MGRRMVIDACCALNVLATRRELDIVRACDLQLVISDRAHREALYLHTPPDDEGVRRKAPASLDRLRAAGRLEVRGIDDGAVGGAVLDAFVVCAAQLRDADASCVALAGVLGLPLMTDDAKQRRVARERFPAIELVSTLAVLHEAVRRLELPDPAVLRLVTELRWSGNFAPPRRDPLSPWYAELLQRAGVAG